MDDSDYEALSDTESDSDTNKAPSAGLKSLQEKPEVIDLVNDEKESAPKASKRSNSVEKAITPASVSSAASKSPAGGLGPSTFLGLDRKKMEQERLARQKARKRTAETEPERAAKVSKMDTGFVQTLNHQANSPMPSTKASTTQPQSTDQASTSLQFPDGAIKRTWALGHPRKNDIKIEEILQKQDLNVALISSWQLDWDWLGNKLDLQKTKVIMCLECKNEEDKAQWRRDASEWSKLLRVCFPPINGGIYSHMHSKLMLLFHKDFLRVVVPTANLTKFDWGEPLGIGKPSCIENIVFLIDLPRLPETSLDTSNPTLTPFAHTLMKFLHHMEVDAGIENDSQTVLNGLLKFDFTRTKHIALVHSISGAHYGKDSELTGYPGLSNAVRELSLQHQGPIEVDYATASLGQLNEEMLGNMYQVLRGGLVELPSSAASSAATKKKNATVSGDGAKNIQDRFRVYFPSCNTVQSSAGGTPSAGTIFLPHKAYSSDSFPKRCLRDHVSTRPCLLSHSKMIFVRPQTTGAPQKASKSKATPPKGFVYIGSANLSQNAWGNVTWDRKEKQGKLTCGNWELGVLVKAGESNGKGLQEVFGEIMGGDFPFEVPGARLVNEQGNEVMKPWVQGG